MSEKEPGGGTQEQVVLDEEFSPLIITVGQYEFFMAHGAVGMDAKAVYEHLQYTARRQQTNTVWAANTYLKKGLCMGEPRIKRAKAFLKEHGIIEYVQRHEDSGQFKRTYIKLRFIHRQTTVDELTEGMETTGGIDTAPPVNRTTGDRRQMLKVNNPNALSEKEKGENSNIKANELFEKLEETAKLYADFPPILGSDERTKAVELAKKHKAHVVIDAWGEYQKQKPGKPFRFFLEDGGVQKFRKENPKPKKDIICPDCGRVVPHLFADTGHCQECENKALREADPSFEPIDFQGLLHSLTDKKTVQKQAV